MIRETSVINISHDYIRGIVQAAGTFTFTTSVKLESLRSRRIPAFQLRMHADNRKLLEAMGDKLGLKNKIYVYRYSKDGAKRQPSALLIVREFDALRSIIIPLFYDQLLGRKKEEFSEWLKRIGTDPTVPKSYKLLYRLHKNGYYRRELCPSGLFQKFLD